MVTSNSWSYVSNSEDRFEPNGNGHSPFHAPNLAPLTPSPTLSPQPHNRHSSYHPIQYPLTSSTSPPFILSSHPPSSHLVCLDPFVLTLVLSLLSVSSLSLALSSFSVRVAPFSDPRSELRSDPRTGPAQFFYVFLRFQMCSPISARRCLGSSLLACLSAMYCSSNMFASLSFARSRLLC